MVEARAKVPGARFSVSGAEKLPHADGEFDGAAMLQSLHHVPSGSMQAALAEATRCVRPGGYLAVIEPMAEGSFFEILKLIDDETAVRAAAQAALEAACESGLLRRKASHRWTRRDTFTSVDDVIARLIANDPERTASALAKRSEMEAAFDRVGEPAFNGRVLVHLTRADVFTG